MPSLPSPSQEQEEILAALREGFHVQVIALAGTGKTTTASLIAKQRAELRILVLTYNRVLADESNRVFRQHSLHNIRCSTYHEQIGRVATASASKRIVCRTDTDVQNVLDNWTVHPPLPIRNYDLIILDETQDMTATRREALKYMLPSHSPSSPKLVVMGDWHQCIYLYDKNDPAETKFLVDAPEEFRDHAGGREWRARSLTVSYRLTPQVARFINLFWKTNIVAGNTTNPDRPVEYWVCNHYGKKLTDRLIALLDEEDQGDVVFLNIGHPVNKETGVERPLKKQINSLLCACNENGKRRFNFHTQQSESEAKASIRNKVRAWTFASSKGCTFPVVVVFGFSVYNGRVPDMNQVCVALSRASRRLIVVHQQDTREEQPYLPPLTSGILKEWVREGVVVCPDGIPHDREMPDAPPPETTTLSVTGLTHLSAVSVSRLLGKGTRTVLSAEGEPLAYEQVHTFHTGEHSSEEDVSAIYGTAIMFAVEDARTKAIKNVDCLLAPVTLLANARYSADTFCTEVERAVDVSLSPSERATLALRVGGNGKTLSGEELACYVRHSHGDFPSLEGHGVRAIRSRDDVFTRSYRDSVRRTYEKEDKTTADYMYLANASLAFEGTHEVFVQVGDVGYDEWVDSHVFEAAVSRIMDVLQKLQKEGGRKEEYEVPLAVPFGVPVQGERRIIVGMNGRVDVQLGDTSLEVKFCSSFHDDHELQSLNYAAMNCITCGKETGTCMLYNARTGGCILHSIDKGKAWELLLEAAHMKT